MTEILSRDIYAPYFVAEIDGTALPTDAVISLSVDENLEAPAKLEITLNEGMDIKTQTFKWLDNPQIDPGKKVKVYFGYAGKEKFELFSGTIKALNPGFQATGIPSLTLEAFDYSHKMQKKMTAFNGQEVSYSDIATELAGVYGLGISGIESTGTKHKKVERKKDEKDYALLKRLAGEVDFEFFVRCDTFNFRKPKDESKAIASFEFEKNFISFTPRLSVSSLVNEVIVTGWDVKTKKKIKESVKLSDVISNLEMKSTIEKYIKSADGLDPKKVERKALESKEDAKKKGEVEIRKSLDTFIQGDLESVGNPELRCGNNVDVKGTGQLFSGDYYIKSAKHSFSGSGYMTTLGLRRNVK
jgi:Bacteriophage probable baseplate hub protein